MMRRQAIKNGTAFGRSFVFEYGCLDGEVVTDQGIVTVIASPEHDYTRLDMAHGGYLHIWSYPKAYTQRHCVTLARKMAAEIAKEPTND